MSGLDVHAPRVVDIPQRQSHIVSRDAYGRKPCRSLGKYWQAAQRRDVTLDFGLEPLGPHANDATGPGSLEVQTGTRARYHTVPKMGRGYQLNGTRGAILD